MKKPTPTSGSRRPKATLDLKAKEVSSSGADKDADNKQKQETGRAGKSTGSTGAKSSSAAPGRDNRSDAAKKDDARSAGATKRDTGKTESGKTDAKPATGGAADKSKSASAPNDKPRNGKPGSPTRPAASAAGAPRSTGGGGGGFLSHLLSSVAGAVLGILGLSFASNQDLMPQGFEIGAGRSTKQQVASLERRIDELRRETAAEGDDSLKGQLAALGARLQQTEASLKGGGEEGASLSEKVQSLETTIKELENAAQTGKGGRLAGLTAVTKQLKRSNDQTARLNTEFIKMREEQTSFRSDLATVRGNQADFNTNTAKLADDLAKLRNELAKVKTDASRPPDISGQINPVTSELGQIKNQVSGLLNREQTARKEGRNIALALSLGELSRAVNQGTPYINELARVKPHVPQSVDIAPLERNADQGLVTMQALRDEFDKLSRKALAAESTATSGSFLDQLMANAKSVVQVRPTGLVEGEETGAILSRMDYRLQRNNLAGALKETEALKGEALTVMQPWLERAQARFAGETILRSLEDKIRTSLAGGASQ